MVMLGIYSVAMLFVCSSSLLLGKSSNFGMVVLFPSWVPKELEGVACAAAVEEGASMSEDTPQSLDEY